MTHESYKAWLDAMPIDHVRRRIERLERKLSDLQVLERLYAERHGGETEAEGEPEEHDESDDATEAVEESGADDQSHSAGEGSEHEPDSEHAHEQG